jgi:N-carbamoylputrescine amidase
VEAQYRELLTLAVEQGAKLVCLPEFSLLPYFPGTRDQSGFAWAELLKTGPTAQFLRVEARVFDPDGQFIIFMRKLHIPSGVGCHETDFFVGYHEYPVHDIGAVKIATSTWNGAEFIFYPTAIGSELTDPDMDSKAQWQLVMCGHVVANGVYIAAANRVGAENGMTFYGSSFICDL